MVPSYNFKGPGDANVRGSAAPGLVVLGTPSVH
jgi:hypothetical protein